MDAWLVAIATSPLVYPALFALVVGDAFLVILPSETAVVALGALAASTGSPFVPALIATAWAGAVVGDLICFGIGRRLGLDRWGWQREGRVRRAIARARSTVLTRTAVLVFTARYVPFARIAVNLAAGASGLPLRRYLPLSAGAGLAWAVFNTVVGAVFGRAMPDAPLLAVLIAVVVAIVLGLLVDAVMRRLSQR